MEDHGIYSICLITGHENIYKKIKVQYTYHYNGEKRIGEHDFSLNMVRKYAVGSRHYIVFNPKYTLMVDTVPMWYTLDAPDEGWSRLPFDCELQKMMNIGYPTPVKEIEGWDKTQKPQKKSYLFRSMHAMQPFFNDIFKTIIVEEIPKNVYDYGDVVVYNRPEGGISMSRIVGLPGDEIATEDFLCIINDQKNEAEVLSKRGDYIIENSKDFHSIPMEVVRERFPNGITVEIFRNENPAEKSKNVIESQIVPEGYFFLLSDSRPFAKDSRYIGPVADSNIKGIVVCIK
jgi:signal peptidase I